MNATQLATFEAIAKEFIQWNMDDSGKGAVDITSVTVLSQKLIVHDHPHDRQLSSSSTVEGLTVEITSVGEYESLIHPAEFDFQLAIQNSFDSNFALFRSNLLDTGDAFFAPMDPTVISKSVKDAAGNNTDSLSKGGYAAIIFCSILFSIIAIIASYYVIRKKAEENNKGTKLSETNMYDDPVGSNLTQESVGPSLKNSKSIEIIKVSDSPEKSPEEEEADEAARQEQEQNGPHKIEINTTPAATPSKEDFAEIIALDHMKPGTSREPMMSPNTMENGRMGALAESILRNESFGSSRDPPESSGRYSNYGGPKAKGDPSARYRPETYHNLPRPEAALHKHQQDKKVSNTRHVLYLFWHSTSALLRIASNIIMMYIFPLLVL
jgi:hypothetical protein